MKRFFIALFLVLTLTLICGEINLPEKAPVELESYANFDYSEINESSAITKSRTWSDLYWTLNDSGDQARIFPFNRNGEVYRAEWYKDEAGIYIPNAVNIDWEDLTVDNQGNLYIGACGNNSNARKDLAIYILKDPLPQITGQTRVAKTIRFFYPEQTDFPPEKKNYDCEAIFTANDKLYLLTKHRSDTFTCLYRFDSMDEQIDNPITFIDSFDIGGMVTSADCTPDGSRLAVLTYNSIWVFESDKQDWFNGEISWLPISAKQCEGICWDSDKLLITNEQTEIFEINPDNLVKVN